MDYEADVRSKEMLKALDDYTPEYWRKLKAARGWLTVKHGQRKPRKWRESTVEKRKGGKP